MNRVIQCHQRRLWMHAICCMLVIFSLLEAIFPINRNGISTLWERELGTLCNGNYPRMPRVDATMALRPVIEG